MQFCHVLHGTKLLLTAPRADAEPGPVLPWGSEASEVRFPAGGVLQQEAAEWLLRPEAEGKGRGGPLCLEGGFSRLPAEVFSIKVKKHCYDNTSKWDK